MSTEEKTRHERMQEIERKHLGLCMEQVWPTGRRCVIERRQLIDHRSTVVVIKWFEKSVPKNSYAAWPEITSMDVYLPIQDDNTFDGMDRALDLYRSTLK
jgi:hypothetical protein